MIPKSAGRRKACQRVCGIHLPHVFDFNCDNGLLHKQWFLVSSRSDLQIRDEATWTCMRTRPLHVPRAISTRVFAFRAIHLPIQACGSIHKCELYSSASPLLHAITGCRLHRCCTKWTPTCSTLPLRDFRLLAPSAQSESVVSFALVFSLCCNGWQKTRRGDLFTHLHKSFGLSQSLPRR